MATPSSVIVPLMQSFAIAFTRPTFEHVLTLMGDALWASSRRTVASALRAVCLIDEPHFTTYHRVLNRPVWSPLPLSRIPLGLVIDAFVDDQPVLIAIDDTLERRFGRRVAHEGIYHDAVRSKPGHPVTISGIRWLCCSAIVRLPPEQSSLGLAVPHHPDAITRREHEATRGPLHCFGTRRPASATPSSLATGPPPGARG